MNTEKGNTLSTPESTYNRGIRMINKSEEVRKKPGYQLVANRMFFDGLRLLEKSVIAAEQRQRLVVR